MMSIKKRLRESLLVTYFLYTSDNVTRTTFSESMISPLTTIGPVALSK